MKILFSLAASVLPTFWHVHGPLEDEEEGCVQANSPDALTTRCTGVAPPLPADGVSSKATPVGGCTP